jgi:hypothetical protein
LTHRGSTSIFPRDSARVRGGDRQPVILVIVNCDSYFGDEERPERDDGISEGFKSVCPIGNPISHSTHAGFSAPEVSETTIDRATSLSRFGNFAFAVFSVKLAAMALHERGVGHKKPSVASMPGAEVGSAYAVPESIIPDLGQVAKDGSESSSKDSWDVFQHDDRGSKLANKSEDLRPETASSAFDTSAFSSVAKVLAWESGADGVDWSINIVLCKFGDVWKTRHVWPPLCQDCARKWLNLAKGHSLKSASHFSADAEAADTAEKIKKAQFHFGPHRRAAASLAHTGQRSGE